MLGICPTGGVPLHDFPKIHFRLVFSTLTEAKTAVLSCFRQSMDKGSPKKHRTGHVTLLFSRAFYFITFFYHDCINFITNILSQILYHNILSQLFITFYHEFYHVFIMFYHVLSRILSQVLSRILSRFRFYHVFYHVLYHVFYHTSNKSAAGC